METGEQDILINVGSDVKFRLPDYKESFRLFTCPDWWPRVHGNQFWLSEIAIFIAEEDYSEDPYDIEQSDGIRVDLKYDNVVYHFNCVGEVAINWNALLLWG